MMDIREILTDYIDTRSWNGDRSVEKELISQFIVRYVDPNKTNKIFTLRIKPGFFFDGASIPRVVWPIVGHPWGIYLPAALAHDIAYAGELMSREDADSLFLAIMRYVGVKTWRHTVMHRAVRAAGWLTWRKHTEKSIAYARSYASLTESDFI